MIIPVYVASVVVWSPAIEGRPSEPTGEWTEASFDPIITKFETKASGRMYETTLGERPFYWVKTPALSRFEVDRQGAVVAYRDEKYCCRSVSIVLASVFAATGSPSWSFAEPPVDGDRSREPVGDCSHPIGYLGGLTFQNERSTRPLRRCELPLPWKRAAKAEVSADRDERHGRSIQERNSVDEATVEPSGQLMMF